ncbi:MAG: hypothetical protein PHV32_06525 [Eubacteriales bacterium]|nr:hypothetical protein [Eubacteriales bacterium]
MEKHFIKKRYFFALFVVVTIALSTLQLNLSAFTNSDRQAIIFYSSQGVEDALSCINVIKIEEDDSFSMIKEYTNFNKITFENTTHQYKDINNKVFVFSVDTIENNKGVQSYAQEILNKGGKVYLYGSGLTPRKYERLMDIENVIAVSDDNVNSLKNNSSSKPVIGLSDNSKFDVIGYSIKQQDVPYFAKINCYDENGATNDKKLYMYLRKAIDNEIRKIKKAKTVDAKFLGMALPFLSVNVAHASSTQVTSEANIDTDTYYNGTLSGNLNTDWYLYRDYDEQDPTYDRFTLVSHHEMNGFNNFRPLEMTVQDGLSGSEYGDEIYDWEPGDASSQSSWSFTIPWGISVSFNSGGNIKVDECGSQLSDYGKWICEPNFWNEVMPNPTRFKPSTAWSSTGTYAMIDNTIDVKYRYYYATISDNQQNYIRYDY